MKQKTVVACFLALIASLGLVGLMFPHGGATYSTDIGSLRARFNEDAGTVRLILLLSPT